MVWSVIYSVEVVSLSDGGSHGSAQRERLESLSDGGSHASAHKLPDESLGGTHGSAHRLRFVADGVKGTNAGASAENVGVRGVLSVGVKHLGVEARARAARCLRSLSAFFED